MIQRLMNFIVCPECKHEDLRLNMIKTGKESIKIPTQKLINLPEYFVFRDAPNANLLLKWQLNNTWISWPANKDYVVNINSSNPLKGTIISNKSDTYFLNLKGILNNKAKILINNINIGTFHAANNNLFDNIDLGKQFLNKDINSIELIPLKYTEPDYIHRDLIHLNQNCLKNPISATNIPNECPNIIEGIISCDNCKNKFPIIGGIPILLKKYLLKTYFDNRKIPDYIAKAIGKSYNDDYIDKGIKYKISEISINKSNKLPDGFFESLRSLPFIPQDTQRSQEKLLSFSLLVFLLNPKTNEIIFDSGAGSGWTSKFLSKIGCEVISSDINFDYVREGLSDTRESFYHRLVCDSENIPIKSNLVDSIFSYDSFHHMPNKPKCIENFFNILTNGGKIVFYEPKAIHSTNYFPKMVMNNYSILEEGFTEADFIKYISNLDFKEPVFHQNHYFKDSHIILLSKIGYRNNTSFSPSILGARYTILYKSIKKKVIEITLDIKNIGDTTWLHSERSSITGAVYIRATAYDDKNEKLFEKIISINDNVLPSDSIRQNVIIKDKLISNVNNIEIDLFVFGLLDFKNAHASPPFKLRLDTQSSQKC